MSLITNLMGGSLLSKTKSNYAKLKGSSGSLSGGSFPNQIVYPSGLVSGHEGHGHFILFNINRLTSSTYQDKTPNSENDIKAGTSSGNKPVFYDRGYTIQKQLGGEGRHKRSNQSIALSMPDAVSTSYGIDWTATELGMSGKLAREIATYDQNSLNDIANAFKEGLKNTVTGAVESLTGIDVKQTAELYTGTIQNPFLEVLFKGVRTRDISFEFTFLPTNESESRTVAEIIRRFKFHSHPEFKYKENDSSYFLYPSTFDITFMRLVQGSAERNAYMHRIMTCALTGIDVDETPSGFSVHADGSMVARKMRLNFIELSPLRKTDFLDLGDSF